MKYDNMKTENSISENKSSVKKQNKSQMIKSCSNMIIAPIIPVETTGAVPQKAATFRLSI